MAPAELLQEVKTAPAPEVLGIFEAKAGDEYVLERAHEDGADLYMMYHINPEINDGIGDRKKIIHKDDDFRAALRVTGVDSGDPSEPHPVHLDVIVEPQATTKVKFSLLKTVLEDIKENYPVGSHGVEVELHPGKVDFDIKTHEAIFDKEPQQIFERLGFHALNNDPEDLFLVKDPEPEFVQQSAHELAA